MKRTDPEIGGAESLKILLRNVLKRTEYESLYNGVKDFKAYNDDIQKMRVKDLSDSEMLYLVLNWIFSSVPLKNPELADFSDEEILNEFNHRIEDGRIASNTRFHVTQKGSIK